MKMEQYPLSLYFEVESRIITPFTTLDKHISKHLNEADVKTRPTASNGLWCHILVPTILIAYSYLDNVSNLYRITAFVSVGLLFYCILFLVFLSTSSAVLKDQVYGGCVASGLISTLLIYLLLKQGLLFSLLVSMAAIHFFAFLLHTFLKGLPQTFTVGEAMIVAQIVVLFVVMSLIKFFFEQESSDSELDFISVIIYTVLSTVGLVVAVLYLLKDSQRNLLVLGYIVVSAAIFVLLMLHTVLGHDCLATIINYIFVEKNRYQIFTFWLILLILAICALMVRTKLAVKASTVTRKTFHVLASCVFLSGIVLDVRLMTLAAGIGLGVLIFVEALRKSRIEPISSGLESAFEVYSDEKDCGVLAMTPLYLYFALAGPLLALPGAGPLELLSGVLAVGVGDTAASWCGSRYGTCKWPGSNRTLEGTVFNILSQMLTVYALELFELVSCRHALLRTGIAATAAGLAEARMEQVDNLVLPLITLVAFQATSFLA